MSLGLAACVPACPARAAGAGPTCTPDQPEASALLGGVLTVSPVPGSRDASPQTQISLLGVPPRRLRVVSVVGSKSGPHSGRLEPYSQGDGASYLPARTFAEGERVTVRVQVTRGRSAVTLTDRFAIASQDAISTTPETIHPGRPSEVQGFHSRPDLHPPVVAVRVSSPETAPGNLLIAPYSGPGQAGPMILDPTGGLVWFKPLPEHTSAANLQVQPYQGRPALTWWQGDITVHGFGLGEDVIADSAYRVLARVRAGNGLQADLHDFQLTPAGSALITAYDPLLCNLSSIGGSGSGAVTDGVLQEIDVTTGLVRFQWTSLDHVALEDSHAHVSGTSTSQPFDFFHLNSIARLQDKSLLISARNTWSAYDLDPRTGRIAWRLGGRHSTFAMGPGTGTAWQHDPRVLDGTTISLFDNGAGPKVHDQSRGIVIGLDATHRRATLLERFTHPSRLVSESQGNMQALANGDWLIGWGQVPEFSEFSPTGALLFDAKLPARDESYRAFRLAWSAIPSHVPAFAVQGSGQTGRVLYASWNGATGVSAWRVLAGTSPQSLRALVQQPRTGFETALALPAALPGPYVSVQALDASGTVLASAAPQLLAG